ncbi:nitroreductase [Mycolicibacterium setense]|uniref:nitroreductase n=1 Tax=Mycolicibacterium setense TaxID=431269 RepID=UPI00068AC29C|nr:nitroreductase [Mycolicibacterium setense]MCV7109770.1 nitroreductase [Mycolicibacterium setense]
MHECEPSEGLRMLLAARHSCRAFLPRQVPQSLVRAVLEDAQRTPSWCNTQPWQVVVTAGAETLRLSDRLMDCVRGGSGGYDIDPPAHYEGIYQQRRRGAGFALYDSVGIAHDDADARIGQALENFRFFGAPHVVVVTSEAALGPYGYVDCGGYVTTLLLAAQSRGLATIAQASVAGYSDAVREALGLPDTRHVVCAVALGYPDREHPVNAFRTDRTPLSEVADLRGFHADTGVVLQQSADVRPE